MSSEENLECGSSLAEREHGGEDMPPPARRAIAAVPRGRDDVAEEAYSQAAAPFSNSNGDAAAALFSETEITSISSITSPSP